MTQQPIQPRNLLLDPDDLPVNRLTVSPVEDRQGCGQYPYPSRPRLVWDRSQHLRQTYGHLGETALRLIELSYNAATKGKLAWAGEEDLF
jgi:hypothetical protein